MKIMVGRHSVPESEFRKRLFGKTEEEYIVTKFRVYKAGYSSNAGFGTAEIFRSHDPLLARKEGKYIWCTAKEVNGRIGAKILVEAVQ